MKLLKANTDNVCDYFITSKFRSQIDWLDRENRAWAFMLHSLFGGNLPIISQVSMELIPAFRECRILQALWLSVLNIHACC